jgi:hypothetical protein
MSQGQTTANGHAMPHWTDGLSDEQINAIERLAGLPLPTCDKECEGGKAAKTLGMRAPTLNELIRAARKEANGKGASEDDELSQKERLIAIGLDAELWHDADGNAFASVMVDGHRENFPIRSRKFREWLTGAYGDQVQISIDGKLCPMAPATQSLTEAIAALSAKAVKGEEHQPAIRVGEHEGQTYIDLGTPDWVAVEVSTKGWQIVSTLPVRFLRPKGFRPLPVPVRRTQGSNKHSLGNFLNVGSDDDMILIVATLVSYLCPHGPYVILIINGEHGSAKSTICKVIRALIDPNVAPLRPAPRSEDDLMIAGKNSWVIAFDNLSYLKIDLSDALCRIASGGGWGKRQLYTDDEEVLINVCRPILANGISQFATRPDLLDRAIIIEAPTMNEGKRLSEAEFWAAFDDVAPQIFAELLGILSGAMRLLPTVKLNCKPRMLDFALLSEAACQVLGLEPGKFEKAYIENRKAGVDAAIDADHVSQAMIDWITRELSYPIGKGLWRKTETARLTREPITASGLLGSLTGELPTKMGGDSMPVPILPERWPKDGPRLGKALVRVQPALRTRGIELESWRETTTKKRERMITVSVPETWLQTENAS